MANGAWWALGALATGALLGRRGAPARGSPRPWAYHLSYISDLPQIEAQGLVPQADTGQAWGNEPGVYFVQTFGHEAGVPFGEDSVWLRFPWPSSVARPGLMNDAFDEWRTIQAVPPDSIEVLLDVEGSPVQDEAEGAWTRLVSELEVVRRLTQAQATRLQQILEQNMLNGWIAEGDLLDPVELSGFIKLAMDQHEGDDPTPGRRARDKRLLAQALAKVTPP